MPAVPAPVSPRRFLPEVQALRALAVTLVVVYHLYPKAAPGGFVGVDVFFVISGFLITGHLLREVRTTGRISLPKFWAARIRRIMPAAIVTVLAVVAATLAWWPSTQWGDITRQAVASLLSVENWALAADSVDYLAADNAPTAVQHFWSLGVEEQFYVAWPLLVLLVVAVAGAPSRAKRRGGEAGVRPRGGAGRHLGDGRHFGDGAPSGREGRGIRPVAALFFAVVIVASLVYSIHLVRGGDPAAYFVTTARVWELGIGGLLAAALPAAGWNAHPVVRKTVALAGLAVLVYVAFGYSDATPFPGQGAVLPVLGTAAIIAAGRTSGWGSLHPVTDFRPVQWVGDTSYSLYLWHWPVIMVFHQLVSPRPHWWQAVGLVLVSLVLASASYYLVERPARRWRFTAKHTWRTVGIGAVVTALAVGVAFVPSVRAQAVAEQQATAAQALLAAKPSGFGAAAWDTAGGAAFVDGKSIVPVPARAGSDRQDRKGCFGEVAAASTPRCVQGDVKATRTVALVGDSHAEQWLRSLDAMAKRTGWRLVTYVKKSCPFTSVPRVLERQGTSDCIAANKATLASLLREKPQAVITEDWTGSSYVADPRPGFADVFRQLQATGSRVIVVRDTPTPSLPGGQMVRDCVAAHLDHPQVCDSRSKKDLRVDGAVDAARTVPGTWVVDVSDRFCAEGVCPAVIGNVLVYRDANHAGDTFLATVAPTLQQRLPAGILGGKGEPSPSVG